MGKIQFNRMISFLVLLVAVAICMLPALAENQTVSIAYRGAGGYYIGDTIIFDGYNRAGNVTVLELTGPGLPAGGVPVYDLNGKEGTGNPIEVNDDGSWRFVWYTSNIKGVDKMQTARYYITALDFGNPTQSATTSMMMKKPDFYIVASPNQLETGDYVQLLGTAERGTAAIRIQITDGNGRVLHTYDTSASASGYFNYGFHIDMPPGDYTITISSPSVISTYSTMLTVIPPPTPTPTVTNASITGNQSGTTPVGPSMTTGTLSVSSTPSGAPVYLDSTPMGNTPVTLQNLTPGSHLVEIKNPGYLPYSVQVSVKAGEQTAVIPTLVKNPLSLPLSPITTLLGLIIAGAIVFVMSAERKNA
jgi:hypothetical protein